MDAIVADPAAFKARLPAALQASLPDDANGLQHSSGGGVVIHHSSGYLTNAPKFTAVFDTLYGGGMQHAVHLDITGAEVKLCCHTQCTKDAVPSVPREAKSGQLAIGVYSWGRGVRLWRLCDHH